MRKIAWLQAAGGDTQGAAQTLDQALDVAASIENSPDPAAKIRASR